MISNEVLEQVLRELVNCHDNDGWITAVEMTKRLGGTVRSANDFGKTSGALQVLEARGYAESRWDADDGSTDARPRRRQYRIAPGRREEIRLELAQLTANQGSAPSPALRPRPSES